MGVHTACRLAARGGNVFEGLQLLHFSVAAVDAPPACHFELKLPWTCMVLGGHVMLGLEAKSCRKLPARFQRGHSQDGQG